MPETCKTRNVASICSMLLSWQVQEGREVCMSYESLPLLTRLLSDTAVKRVMTATILCFEQK